MHVDDAASLQGEVDATALELLHEHRDVEASHVEAREVAAL